MGEFNFEEWLDKYAQRYFPNHKQWYVSSYKQMRKNGMGVSEDERFARLEHAKAQLIQLGVDYEARS